MAAPVATEKTSACAARPAHGRCSVALALCEGERYLEELFGSLFRQSVPPDEIVVCDDASLDGSEKIVEKFIAAHPGVIRYERNAQRLGAAKNFEKAVSLTTGDIIFLADQDDLWLPDKIEHLRDAIESVPFPAGAFCNSLLTDAELNPLGTTHWELRNFRAGENFSAEDQFRRSCSTAPMAGHNIAFDAAWKTRLLPFPDLAEAHDNWIGLVLAAFGAWQVVPEILTLYRRHDRTLTGAAKKPTAFALARSALRENRDEWNYRLFRALTERLQSARESCGDDVLSLASGRRDYSLRRKNLSRHFWKRIVPVLRIWFSGDYAIYGHGALNAVQDLFMRSFYFPGKPDHD